MQLQRTIKNVVSFKGIGLHMGKEVTMTLEPARPNSGIVFVREDLPGSPQIRARVDRVISNMRGTSIGNEKIKIHTVEHILATLSGLRIDNVIIKMDGEEVPAADGSALPFVELIQKAQIEPQKVPRNFFKVEEPLWLEERDKRAMVLPDNELKITYVVDFPYSPLKTQFAEFVINEETFIQEIAPSRTFGFMEEVEELRKKGLIQGGSLDNAVVIDKNGVVNKEGLRFSNEPVRHKILDLLGDLYLIGEPIQAHILAIKSGHSFNVKLAQKLDSLRKEVKGKVILDVNAIQRILPHRYPFLLVDRIIEMGEKEIVGIKNVTINEPFFRGHFPGHPVMPAALIIEAMAQVAGVYLLNKSENQGKLAYFAGIDKARFRRPVVPGDQLVTKVKILNLRRNTGKVEAIGTVRGKKVAEAIFIFSLVKR